MKILCGTDLVEIERFKKILENNESSFINKCFTEKEQEFCRTKAGILLRPKSSTLQF